MTRILKEAWLFGKLQTVGGSEAETRAEGAAAEVAEGLGRLLGPGGVEGGGSVGSNGDSRDGKEGEGRGGV